MHRRLDRQAVMNSVGDERGEWRPDPGSGRRLPGAGGLVADGERTSGGVPWSRRVWCQQP